MKQREMRVNLFLGILLHFIRAMQATKKYKIQRRFFVKGMLLLLSSTQKEKVVDDNILLVSSNLL